jgi:hypothetical protein
MPRSIRFCRPSGVTATLAQRLMEQTRIFPALTGVRGHPPVDLVALEQLLVRFSYLVAEQRQTKGIDINPLLASPERLLALDARIVLHPLDSSEQLPKLAIRPYPLQYVQQRWGIAGSFKFTKTCLGWEQVQVLDWQAIKTFVAFAWVTAGFLYDMGVTFGWEEVQLLAHLGGWEPHKDRLPGKIVVLRGLGRLLEMLSTQALLSRFVSEHGALPPNILAFL